MKTRTSLEIVERYHEKYLEFEKAFNNDPFNKEDTQKQVEKIVSESNDIDEDEIFKKMASIIFEKQERQSDVNTSAIRFILYVDFYTMTEKKSLPKKILDDYNAIPEQIKNSIKPLNAVVEGKFVRVEKKEITTEEANYLKNIVEQVKSLQ